jgi:RNA polymerase sigma factor (sigma-70 family)
VSGTQPDPERQVEDLLEEHLPALRSFVRLRLGRELRALESSSDLVQSVCREILQHRERFRHGSEEGFRRWLYTSALRKLSNRAAYHRAAKRDGGARVPLEDDSQSPGSDDLLACYGSLCTPSGALSRREEVERIEAAFDALEEGERELIALARIARVPQAEIAQELGISPRAVSMRLYRALERLSAELARRA